MSNPIKLQNCVQNTQGSESVATCSHAQSFEATFQVAFGREMTADERYYFGLDRSAT